MGTVFKDELFDAQWLRAAGHCSSGGADIGECFAAAREIAKPDADQWFAAWSRMADRLLDSAATGAGQGPLGSARSAFLRASNYYRAAYTFLIGGPVDPRVIKTYRKQRFAFEAAVALMTPTAERISIPYGGLGSTAIYFEPAMMVSLGRR